MSGQCKKCGWDGCLCDSPISDTPETDKWTGLRHNIRELCATSRRLERERDRLAEALQKLADCDWVITLPDRMDAVRAIAAEALKSIDQDHTVDADDMIADIKKGEDCPSCENVGWFMVPDCDGEPTPEQCEWCYTTPNSKFNMKGGSDE